MMISDHPGDDDNHRSPYFDADMGKLNGDIADVDVGQHGQQVGEAAGMGTLDCHQDRQFDQHDNHQSKRRVAITNHYLDQYVSYYDNHII